MILESFRIHAPWIALAAFAAAAASTPVVRALARRFGFVAMPKKDRWHKKPTAMLGGIAIFIAVMAIVLAMVPQSRDSWIVLGASTLMFLVGLVDDVLHMKPYQKLICEMVAASAVIFWGLVLPWTASAPVNMLVTAVWLIGITNAVNMLDNMDGLSAGVAAIAAAFLALNFVGNGQVAEALMLTGFAGALLGFLIYNHNPASIFMGDCGSLFIGFFLAGTALLTAAAGGGRSRSVLAVLAVPVLVLCVPIFDTTFVTLVRKLSGRAASQGGRDHTSHRLVALGISEGRAVWMLYALAVTSGCLALLVRHATIDVSVAALTGFIVVLTFVGIHLARVRVYSEAEVASAREKPLVAFLLDLSYKRRVFEVALDALLISMAYYLAYALTFGPMRESGDWHLFMTTLPLVIVVKLLTFLGTGTYRGIWRYASLSTVMMFVRAVVLSSILVLMALVLVFRFDGFSRTALVLDGILTLTLLTLSRFSFRLLRRVFPAPHMRSGRRVLIYGAGDGGELVFREIMNNPALQSVPVGFLDDDPTKAGRLMHGLRVYSAATPLIEICRRLRVEQILISTGKIDEERLRMLVGECAASGLSVARAHMSFQPLSASDFGWVMSSDATAMSAPAPLITRLGDATLVHASRADIGN